MSVASRQRSRGAAASPLRIQIRVDFDQPLDEIERTRRVSNRLGSLTVGSQEASAQTLSIAKPIGTRDGLYRHPTLFEHETGGLQSQRFDCLCRSHAGLDAENATELPRAQASHLGQSFDRERLRQIPPDMVKRILNSVGLSVDLKKRRMLRLASGTSMVDEHGLCGFARFARADIAFDQGQREIKSGGHASRGPDWAVAHEDAIDFDTGFGEASLKFLPVKPVCGGPAAVQQASAAQDECADADRCNAPRLGVTSLQQLNHVCRRVWGVWGR